MVNPSELLDARYRLERLLGTGGMSEVWLAEDTRLGRWVAVKLLRDLSNEPELAGALEKEARIVAQLQHPGIVTVFDVGRHEQQNYLVMEYVHGYSLRQLLSTQGRLTEREALNYGEQVAEVGRRVVRDGLRGRIPTLDGGHFGHQVAGSSTDHGGGGGHPSIQAGESGTGRTAASDPGHS